MPIGPLKNALYGLALPLAGQRCRWRYAGGREARAVARALRRRRAVGACVQRFEKGALTEVVTVGYAALEPEKRAVTADTFFRTASIAKMVSALLVFRLQTLGRLSVREDISDLLGFRVRNPRCPDAPVTLGMLMGHTSSIIDTPAYFAAFHQDTPLSALLADDAAYLPSVPGMTFRYSNLAAGMVACLLEKRFGQSFEALMQNELFGPLGVRGTFDVSSLNENAAADSYRVLPRARAFCAQERVAAAKPLDAPDPERHYLLASGGLFITAPDLARLALVAWRGGDGFLDAQSLTQLQKPMAEWPERAVRMRHCMGLLALEDARVCPRALWGHQGFAYGAVNGVFFDGDGNGFAMLNSGISEQRVGHLALVNRDLIRLWMREKRSGAA